MSLMSLRHKPIHAIVWLACFLTFYLGFNQQVMCFEFSPNGGVQTLHLQLIECNPLGYSSFSRKHDIGLPMSDMMATGLNGNGCPGCRDFHLTFKRTPGVDFSNIGTTISTLHIDCPQLAYRHFSQYSSHLDKISRTSKNPVLTLNSSLKALRSTILLI